MELVYGRPSQREEFRLISPDMLNDLEHSSTTL